MVGGEAGKCLLKNTSHTFNCACENCTNVGLLANGLDVVPTPSPTVGSSWFKEVTYVHTRILSEWIFPTESFWNSSSV
ncbi:hypothetical protein NDU88_002172 [Pleurodeles waltl]|uniref:Wall-associated receptor kinase C-terminal domain-containing protein n=1 Tax=Pleurodeles waltl TaxID=8319 RepID=A0AAV7T1P0_PLEWA|nr:hypothetical protein NDU88_002172 [Pleurodeles waltl]